MFSFASGVSESETWVHCCESEARVIYGLSLPGSQGPRGSAGKIHDDHCTLGQKDVLRFHSRQTLFNAPIQNIQR